MPIYEYHCKDCGAEFDAMVSFSNADKVECESCASKNVERVASAFVCSVSSGGSSAGPYPACGGGG